MSLDKVNKYYNSTWLDYSVLWRLKKGFALHYGYYDSKNRTHDKAVINMNRFLSKIAKIKNGEKVLDAGCGVGGSGIWIAKTTNAKITGLNINERQLEFANNLASNLNLKDKVSFKKGDFCKMPLNPNSFDVVWGIESVCYAKDKKIFLKEARRVLKNKGRIVIADGFLNKENLTLKEDKEMYNWLNGWAVPNLASISQFEGMLRELGFKKIKIYNITKNVIPSSKRMYFASFFAYPIAKLLELFKLRTEVQTGNIISAYFQYKTLKKKLWQYCVFYAEK